MAESHAVKGDTDPFGVGAGSRPQVVNPRRAWVFLLLIPALVGVAAVIVLLAR